MMGPWMMGWTGWALFVPIMMVVFWGLVIWGIVALVRYLIRDTAYKQTASALETLKLRYAHGDMSKAEYVEKKKDLM